MTVCIAAICQNSIIFGASDRMVTSGDIEFEPNLDSIPKPELPLHLQLQHNTNTKIAPLTNSIVAMTAGDSGIQAEIMGLLHALVKQKLESGFPGWIPVSEMVDGYVDAYNQIKLKRARSVVFSKYGLDEHTFIARQHEMSADFISKIVGEIEEFDSFFRDQFGVETIITGNDDASGLAAPHIYAIIKSTNGDSVTCCDSLGFAAVGSGARHAESQFMLAGHARFSPSPDTLLLTYLAKKRSEVAPGVGEGTNMFTIGPNLGSLAMLENIPDIQMERIASICRTLESGQEKVFARAKQKTKEYIDEIFKKRAAQQQLPQDIPSPSDSGSTPKTDTKN